MENNESQVSGQETTSQEQEAQAEVGEQLELSTGAGESISTEEQSGEQPAAPAWTPDYKYKVRDQELEFEDWVKPLITSDEHKKKFQELYTRGHGLELAKQEREAFKNKYSELEDGLQYASELIKNKDFRGFASALNIPKDIILKYAIEELKYHEMSPQEKAQVDAQRNEQHRLQTLEQQNISLQDKYMQAEAERVSRETDFFLQTGETVTYAKGYDALVGTPGAFRSLVLEIGDYHYRNGNTGFTVQQAVQSAVDRVKMSGALAGASSPSQIASGTQANAVQVAAQQAQKPVIPNIQGQGSSPVKKVYNSLDDLRKRYSEMTAGN